MNETDPNTAGYNSLGDGVNKISKSLDSENKKALSLKNFQS